jgi:hypothetical protein
MNFDLALREKTSSAGPVRDKGEAIERERGRTLKRNQSSLE